MSEYSDDKISIAVINTQLAELTRKVDTIMAKMDTTFTTKEELIAAISNIKDHESRLRRLELVGGVAIGLSYALQFYFTFLSGK